MFYVYQHRRNDTNEIFYIGKGYGDRAYTKHNRNDYWRKVASKANGFTVEFIVKNIDEELALLVEQEKIDQLKKLGFWNKLTNITLGGEGVCGLQHSDEAKLKMSFAKKGKPSPRKGAKLSEETRKKISEVQKGKPKKPRTPEHQAKINAINKGSKRSEESKLKMSIAAKKRIANSITGDK